MKKIIFVCLSGFLFVGSVNANEIVKDSKGNYINLLDNGTWSYVGGDKKPIKDISSSSEIIINSGNINIETEDGNKNKVPLDVSVNLDKSKQRSLKVSEIKSMIANTNFTIRIKLKNEYSYKPRSAMLDQKGDNIEVVMKYTATNSYGAETVGYDHANFKLGANGLYRLQIER